LAQPASRVYLVDDDAGVRRALTRVLRNAGYQTAAFGTAEDFLIGVELDELPACLVVDLRMPGLSGLDLQELLVERDIELSLVFVSGRADVQSGVQAMKGGASTSWRSRSRTTALLAASPAGSSRTRAPHPEGRARRAAAAARHADAARARRVRADRDGPAQQAGGARLGTTEKTVKVHRSRVMQKMGAHSLAELVRMADKIALRL
jgi:FixJ family two-component response regulator